MLSTNNIEELIFLREQARLNKDWALSDEIRDFLDEKNVFIFDTKDGYEIYYEVKKITRKELELQIKSDIAANKNFDSWLYSIQNSKEYKRIIKSSICISTDGAFMIFENGIWKKLDKIR